MEARRTGGTLSTLLLEVYHHLLAHYEPQHWWPGDSPFEVMVGAVLTQSVAWVNVEKAIRNLKAAGLFSPIGLRSAPAQEIADAVRPSGYYNAKASKLKALAAWLKESCNDDIEALGTRSTGALREQLLHVHGIGEETADSILLYACHRPCFVIDAYTRRIVGRLGIHVPDARYASYQALFTENLPPDVDLYNEYHALLVHHGKEVCRKAPLCPQCCLTTMCGHAIEGGTPSRPGPPATTPSYRPDESHAR
jgi:endonuclease-3 related protein